MSRTSLLALLLLVAGLVFSCHKTKNPVTPPPPQIPTAPNLFAIISVTQTSMNLNWNDRSQDETGFKVQVYIESENNWFTQANVGAHTGIGTVSYTLSNLNPGTVYRLRVLAFNDAGNSDPSNEQLRSTETAPLPAPPTNIQAVALDAVTVRLSWEDNDAVDAYVIQRHEPTTGWADLAQVADGVIRYVDNSTIALTTYYYRVGSRNANGTAWSLDSATVTTPAPGAPLSPDSLTAEVAIARHVTLRWADQSVNETGFELQRAPYGFEFQPLATLGANSEQYVDELGSNAGIYNYQLRAFNGLGGSGWVRVTVDFRSCSFGVVPLCRQNFWDYLVADTVGTDYEVRYGVLDPAFLGGLDWYPIRATRLDNSDTDTLYYWRNIDQSGTYQLPFPAPNPANGNLLYHWPGSLGSYTLFNGDSVQIISTGTAASVRTESGVDTIFTGCVAYQYLYHGTNRWDQVYVRPDDIGVVLVEQYQRPGTVLVATRNLIRWQVVNH
jgi:hypothetical protein